MNIKLICIDMDGTLLNNDHSISEENKNSIKKATYNGIVVAITTGRLFTSANHYSTLLGITAPIISSNGAYIREKDKDEVIYKSVLSLDETLEIHSILKNYSFETCFNTFDSTLSEKEFPENHAYNITNNLMPENNRIKLITDSNIPKLLNKFDGEILKAICIDREGCNIEEVMRAKKEFLELNKYEVVSSGPNNFEIMKKGTSKGKAVMRLAEMLGINQNEIMCIGDSENDLSMIQFAGIGVAMGNALDILKNESDFVTDTNINSGVSKAIEKFAF